MLGDKDSQQYLADYGTEVGRTAVEVAADTGGDAFEVVTGHTVTGREGDRGAAAVALAVPGVPSSAVKAVKEVASTSRAARRQAMRDAGVPTSQPLVPDRATNSSDQVYLTRDGQYTVQDARNDVSHPGQPHWEAGPTKPDPSKPDGLNRSGTLGGSNKPQMGKPKGKAYYDDKDKND